MKTDLNPQPPTWYADALSIRLVDASSKLLVKSKEGETAKLSYRPTDNLFFLDISSNRDFKC